MAARRSRLIKRRRALGHSQEELAAMIGSDRTTVSRLERGQTTPYPHTRSKLCMALQVTPEELDCLLSPDENSSTSLDPAHPTSSPGVADPQPTGALEMYRRELLRLLSVAGALVTLPAAAPDPPTVADAQRSGDLRQYAALNTHLWQVFGLSTSKRLVYPLVQDQLGVLIDRLDSVGTLTGHRQLCVLACELLQLAGEILFDSNHYADAAHCYALAASAGREAGAYDQWACALTRHAFVSMYDHQYRDASSLLAGAARIATRGDTQLSTRYWVAAVQAETFACLGDLNACERALDAAANVTGLGGPVNPGGWLRFDGGRLREERGTCYLTLGRFELASDALTGALRQSTSLRRRGSFMTDLAVIGARRRDADEVLLRGHAALDAAEQTRSSGYVGRKLRSLRGQLDPLLSDRRIAELNERIIHVLATA